MVPGASWRMPLRACSKEGQWSAFGACVRCTDGKSACSDAGSELRFSCVDTSANGLHCGTCGAACEGEGETCVLGKCTLPDEPAPAPPSKCEPGTYKLHDADSAPCKDCPAGTASSYTGYKAVPCEPCVAGSVAARSGAAYCTLCGPGFYTAEVGAKHCIQCADGTVTDETKNKGWGSTSCRTCTPPYVPNWRQTSCVSVAPSASPSAAPSAPTSAAPTSPPTASPTSSPTMAPTTSDLAPAEADVRVGNVDVKLVVGAAGEPCTTVCRREGNGMRACREDAFDGLKKKLYERVPAWVTDLNLEECTDFQYSGAFKFNPAVYEGKDRDGTRYCMRFLDAPPSADGAAAEAYVDGAGPRCDVRAVPDSDAKAWIHELAFQRVCPCDAQEGSAAGPVPVCGNGRREAGEACDEKDNDDGVPTVCGDCNADCSAENEEHVICKACRAGVTEPGYCAGHPDTEGCA